MLFSLQLHLFHSSPHINIKYGIIDGGFYSNLPYKIAIDEGAKEIWALHIKGKREDFKMLKFLNIINASISYLLEKRIEEQEHLAKHKKIKIHYIPLECPYNLSIFDFNKTRKLIDLGYEITKNYLKNAKIEDGIIKKILRFFK
jgi:predicted acylesterase/phospholipase RssA